MLPELHITGCWESASQYFTYLNISLSILWLPCFPFPFLRAPQSFTKWLGCVRISEDWKRVKIGSVGDTQYGTVYCMLFSRACLAELLWCCQRGSKSCGVGKGSDGRVVEALERQQFRKGDCFLLAPKNRVQRSVLCQFSRNLNKTSEWVLLTPGWMVLCCGYAYLLLDLSVGEAQHWPFTGAVPSLPVGGEGSLTAGGLDHTPPRHRWKSCRLLRCKLAYGSAAYGLMELEKVSLI